MESSWNISAIKMKARAAVRRGKKRACVLVTLDLSYAVGGRKRKESAKLILRSTTE